MFPLVPIPPHTKKLGLLQPVIKKLVQLETLTGNPPQKRGFKSTGFSTPESDFKGTTNSESDGFFTWITGNIVSTMTETLRTLFALDKNIELFVQHLTQMVIIFALISFGGWVYETIYCSVVEGFEHTHVSHLALEGSW